MGQGQGSSRQTTSCRVDRAGLEEEEYLTLCKNLEISEDSIQASVTLPSFLARFPAHLRPLVQPLFFQLARLPAEGTVSAGAITRNPSVNSARSSGTSSPSGRRRSKESSNIGIEGSFTGCSSEPLAAEPAAPWPIFVAGIAELLRDGATWAALLEAWIGEEGGASDPRLASRCEAGTELAVALCFWCAHPRLAPGPGAPGGMPTSAAALLVTGDTALAPLDSVLSVLRPRIHNLSSIVGSDGSSAAFVSHLAADLPCLTRGVGPRLRQALLQVPPALDCPVPESRIIDAGLSFILRGINAQLWSSESWIPLFRDAVDGRSFNGLLKGTLHYGGIAVLLIRGAAGEVLGAVSNCWEEGNGKYGGGAECLLFALRPQLKVCRSTGRFDSYVYLNSRNKHAPRGLGFGGQVGCFRLWIDADMDECQVLESDATYQKGRLLQGNDYQLSFKISHLEVWGASGAEAREAQLEGKARSESVRMQARKVDRARMVENEFDKEMFFSNTFGGSADKTDRAQT